MAFTQEIHQSVIEQLGAAGADLRLLANFWRLSLHGGNAAHAGPDIYAMLASRVIASGNPLFGLEVAAAGSAHYPHDLSLAIVNALALARCGGSDHSLETLTRLAENVSNTRELESSLAEELFGVLARTHKELGYRSSNEGIRQDHFTQAIRWYRLAGSRSGGYWPRINIAAVLALSGHLALAQSDAQQAYHQALFMFDQSSERTDRYWLMATLGEAAALMMQFDRAERYFLSASEIARKQQRLGELASTRLQMRRLAPYLNLDASWVDACLPPPRIAIWAGTDRSFADTLTFDYLSTIQPDAVSFVEIAYGCLQGSADLALCETLQRSGAETIIVLPCPLEVYLRFAHGGLSEKTVERIKSISQNAAQVVIASPGCDRPDDTDFGYARELASGLALLRNHQLSGRIQGFIAGNSGSNDGDYSTIFAAWKRSGVESNASCETMCGAAPESAAKAFLFADFRGFSGLKQSGVERFFEFIWGGIARLLRDRAAGGHQALHANTWGDGLFLVYEHVQDAAQVALDAIAWINASVNARIEFGLPEDLAMRIGLHAGSARPFVDPITGVHSYASTHASFAARLEPTTPPGMVYASQAFAALLELHGAGDVDCRMVGQLEWGKGIGRQPTYRLTR